MTMSMSPWCGMLMLAGLVGHAATLVVPAGGGAAVVAPLNATPYGSLSPIPEAYGLFDHGDNSVRAHRTRGGVAKAAAQFELGVESLFHNATAKAIVHELAQNLTKVVAHSLAGLGRGNRKESSCCSGKLYDPLDTKSRPIHLKPERSASTWPCGHSRGCEDGFHNGTITFSFRWVTNGGLHCNLAAEENMIWIDGLMDQWRHEFPKPLKTKLVQLMDPKTKGGLKALMTQIIAVARARLWTQGTFLIDEEKAEKKRNEKITEKMKNHSSSKERRDFDKGLFAFDDQDVIQLIQIAMGRCNLIGGGFSGEEKCARLYSKEFDGKWVEAALNKGASE